MPVDVDTKRSWIILGCCFSINLIVEGIGRLSGIFFVASMAKFNVDRTAASFPYTFCAFVKCASGPLIGSLGHTFGIQKILIIGSLVATIGLGACFFVEKIGFISLFFGVIHGLGGGSFLLLPVLINQHFEKYRAIASGIRITGRSLGSFILPPVTENLLEKYGLSETFLILSGLVFICVPASLLLGTMRFNFSPRKHSKPPPFSCIDTEKQPLLQDGKSRMQYSEKNSIQKKLNESKEEKHLKQKLSRQCPEVESVSDESTIIENSILTNENLEKCQSANNNIKKYSKENLNLGEKEAEDNKEIPKHILDSSKSISPLTKNSKATQKVTFFDVIIDPVFLILALETGIYTFTNTCLITIIVDFAKDIGLSDQEQGYTIMAISIGELIGPLCLGWLVDKSYVKKTTFLTITSLLQSFLIVTISFSNGSLMLLSLLGVAGFVHSAESFVQPLLVPDFISESKQTIALPSIVILAAPFTLLISPLIGFLREGLGSYKYILYILGALSAICGSIFLIIPRLSKSKK